ncbi:MAG: hypothetical protein IKM07_03055, partial [Clostridia bacterium]|nr:hypothetical protein [Clostridia bacterium]
IVQGLLAPSTLGRVQRTLHPEERKAFLIRLRRLASTAFHDPVLHFLFYEKELRRQPQLLSVMHLIIFPG